MIALRTDTLTCINLLENQVFSPQVKVYEKVLLF